VWRIVGQEVFNSNEVMSFINAQIVLTFVIVDRCIIGSRILSSDMSNTWKEGAGLDRLLLDALAKY